MAQGKEPLRILHVFGNLGHGGAESRIIDLYRHIDRTRVQFDFVVHYEAAETGERCPDSDTLLSVRRPDYFDEQVRDLGGRIYAVPRFKGWNLIDYKRAWTRLFEMNRGTWRAVQGHMTSTAAIYLPIARAAGIGLTIAHARSAGTDPGLKGAMTRFIRRPLQEDGVCDVSIACTREAGEAVFGARRMRNGQVVIVPNAIDIAAFSCEPEKRARIREEFGLKDAVVIGHVGRMHYAKNHDLLMRLFAAMKEKSDLPLKLLLVGGGTTHYVDEVRAMPKRYGIEQDAIFAGDRTDVSAFYAAFDYFCFPSRYEGLPGSVIEAQASGLDCLISDRITEDVDVTPLVKRLDIEEAPERWAEVILQSMAPQGTYDAADALQKRMERIPETQTILKEVGFDVNTQAERMMAFYESGSFGT